MPFNNVLASVAVRHLPDAVQWYESVLGRPADRKPMPTLAEWSFPGGGVLQLYELAERAGDTSCTLAVTALEQEISRLDALGVDTGTRTHSAQVNTVMIQDGDGNHIALAEALASSVSR